MKDNNISSNNISGVSLERREKNKKLFREEQDHQNSRACYEGREQRGIHL